jgi:hypothetical protein
MVSRVRLSVSHLSSFIACGHTSFPLQGVVVSP